ncbi:hypothetical protein BX616_010058 [Lobosporangium transversale]|nr:hypothetical protein BX616_010058 [Lobosporangium transversale]
MENVFSVPELLHHIQLWLSKTDLANCILVSKAFQKTFTPLLWHTISLKTLVQHRRFTENPEVQHALARNMVHIRVIQIQSCKSLEPFLMADISQLKHLHTLEFPWPARADTDYRGFLKRQRLTITPDGTPIYVNATPAPDSIGNPPIDSTLLGPVDWMDMKSVFLIYYQKMELHSHLQRCEREVIQQFKQEYHTWVVENFQKYHQLAEQYMAESLQAGEAGYPVLGTTANGAAAATAAAETTKQWIGMLLWEITHYIRLVDSFLIMPLSIRPTTLEQELLDWFRRLKEQKKTLLDITEVLEERYSAATRIRTRQDQIVEQQASPKDKSAQRKPLNTSEQLYRLHSTLKTQWEEIPQNTCVIQSRLRMLRDPTSLSSSQVVDGFGIFPHQSRLQCEQQTESQRLRDEVENMLLRLQGGNNNGQGKLIVRKQVPRDDLDLFLDQIYIFIRSLAQDERSAVIDRIQQQVSLTSTEPPSSPDRRRPPASTVPKPLPWDYDTDQDRNHLVQFLHHAPKITAFHSARPLTWDCGLYQALSTRLKTFSEMTSISIYTQELDQHWCSGNLEHLLDACSPQLEALRIAGPQTFRAEVLAQNVGALQSSQNCSQAKKMRQIETSRTSLRRLALEGDCKHYFRPSFLNRCPELKSLSLSDCQDSLVEDISRWIQSCCPLLEELAISKVTEPRAAGALDAILGACVGLSSSTDLRSCTVPLLKKGNVYVNSQAGQTTNLKSLLVFGYQFAEHDPAIDAICQHGRKGLRYFALKSCEGLWTRRQLDLATHEMKIIEGDPPQIYRVLEALGPQLEYLDLLHYGGVPLRSPAYSRFEATDFAKYAYANNNFNSGNGHHDDNSSDNSNGSASTGNRSMTKDQCGNGQRLIWVFIPTLKVLRICIGGFYRPTLDNRHSTTIYPFNPRIKDPIMSRDIEIRVCQILGSFSALEELHLGLDEADGPYCIGDPSMMFQNTSLALSLDHGLWAMSGLKQLKVLKVTRMDHRIGLEEIQWMCEHWPRLDIVHGLLRQMSTKESIGLQERWEQQKAENERIVKWLKANKPFLRYT